MKKILTVILVGLVLLLTLAPASILANENDIRYSQQLEVEGIVKINNLEGGFYQVRGYRLVGDIDFSVYNNKIVRIIGVEDYSPSIFMTVGFKVNTIEVINRNEIKSKLYSQIKQSKEHIDNINKNIDKYIKMYGEDSTDVRHYKEEVRLLTNDIISMLEEIILNDGKYVDLDVYKELGSYLIDNEKIINVFINGERPVYEQNQLPVIEDGRTLIPFRLVAETLGASVEWDREQYKVIVKKDDIFVELYINKKLAYINGNPIKLDVPARIINDRTMVPLRFVAESLDANVEWIQKGQIAIINQVEPISDSDFEIAINNNFIKLFDWDNKINLNGILGTPITEKVEQLGEGADTFMGSFIKTITYDGVNLRLLSPKTNGQTFFIDKIELLSNNYSTSRNIRVGDSYNKLLCAYGIPNGTIIGEDKENHTYNFNDGNTNNLYFEVQKGLVKSIILLIEHP